MNPREKLVARTCVLLGALVAVGSIASLFSPPQASAERGRRMEETDRRTIDALRIQAREAPRPRPSEGPWYRSAPAPRTGR
ncbi:MAG TPA: hypothetical protein VFI25_13175 [Planctomycetota bacterium]|nr:hypothetical protein [Planctomycetota bacterium]